MSKIPAMKQVSPITVLGHALNGPASWAVRQDIALTSEDNRHGMQASGGWLYAISEAMTPLVKIGHSRFGLLQRLKNLAYEIQAPVVLVGTMAVTAEVRYLEYRVHGLLHQYRIHKEWFYLHMNPTLFEEVVHQALNNHNAVRARVRSLACE